MNFEENCNKIEKYGIKNVCLSGLVFTTRVHLPLLNQVNKFILDQIYVRLICDRLGNK